MKQIIKIEKEYRPCSDCPSFATDTDTRISLVNENEATEPKAWEELDDSSYAVAFLDNEELVNRLNSLDEDDEDAEDTYMDVLEDVEEIAISKGLVPYGFAYGNARDGWYPLYKNKDRQIEVEDLYDLCDYINISEEYPKDVYAIIREKGWEVPECDHFGDCVCCEEFGLDSFTSILAVDREKRQVAYLADFWVVKEY